MRSAWYVVYINLIQAKVQVNQLNSKDDFHDEDVLPPHDDLVGVSVAAAIRRPVLRRGGAEHADGPATAHDGGRLQGETGR